MNLTINVDATDKTQAAVAAAVANPVPVSELQLLVLGDIEPLVLSFCDSAGATPAFVTDATTLLAVGLGCPDVDGAQDYASTGNFTIVGSTRVGALSLTTAALRTALYNALACGQRRSASMVLQIRKTTAAGLVQSLALLTVLVAEKVLPPSAPENTDSYAATKVIGSDHVVDWSLGNTFSQTLSANTAFTFLNATDGHTIVVALTNTVANYTVSWPTVSWSGGSAPVQTTGAKADIYTFTKIGTTLFGAVVQNF